MPVGGFARSAAILALGGSILIPVARAQQYSESAAVKPVGLNFDVGISFDDNVTRSMGPGQKLSDQALNFNANKSEIVGLSDNSRLVVQGFLGAERFRTYVGLSRVFAGVQGQYQYRPSGDFGAPTYELSARASVDGYETAQRDGFRHALGAGVRGPLSDRVTMFAALAHNQRIATSSIFSTRENSGRVNLDYAISGKATLYVTGEYRRGTVVSTGLATLANVDVAELIVRDAAFTDTARFAYRVKARTYLGTLGFNYAIDEQNALDFSWRWVKSTPNSQPNFNGAEHVSYSVNQYNLTYLFRF